MATSMIKQASLCKVIKSSTTVPTGGTTLNFDESLENYDFVLVGASWGLGGVITGYLYVPVAWWYGTSDVLKIYLNNNPSNDSLTISNRDNSKATISSSNGNLACQIMGIRL
jgi:hypothetical protein